VVTMRPGTLDDTRWLKPAAQLFTRSAQAWACSDELPSYTTQPESYREIGEYWRELGLKFVPS
jgi:hypothetical protein